MMLSQDGLGAGLNNGSHKAARTKAPCLGSEGGEESQMDISYVMSFALKTSRAVSYQY